MSTNEHTHEIQIAPPEPDELIYLTSPYSHGNPLMERIRFNQAVSWAADLTNLGHIVFSPIVHSRPLEMHGDGIKGNWDFWQRIDETFMRRCDRLVVLCVYGWGESVGVTAEIAFMRARSD